MTQIPVIGLAKEFEEIFRPGESEPLRLSHDSGALKLLQRVRDESHRFANTYNAQLRLKRISESILDEFPGIGGQRKAALLKKFGSVQRLRLATVEDRGRPGFGGKTAAALKNSSKPAPPRPPNPPLAQPIPAPIGRAASNPHTCSDSDGPMAQPCMSSEARRHDQTLFHAPIPHGPPGRLPPK